MHPSLRVLLIELLSIIHNCYPFLSQASFLFRRDETKGAISDIKKYICHSIDIGIFNKNIKFLEHDLEK
jgi:hypothetical protein